MFNINDVVLYGRSGVCKITDIQSKGFGNSNNALYYVLNPVYDSRSVFYIPLDSKTVSMRKLLSGEELQELVKTVPDEPDVWVDNDRQRNETFTKIIKTGSHSVLIKLIKTVSHITESNDIPDKKLNASDKRAMKEAERLLSEEFAYVLHINPEEVLPYILSI